MGKVKRDNKKVFREITNRERAYKMTEFIQVDYKDGESKEVYEMNDGQRLFDFIKANFDKGTKIELEVIELTDEQWKECQRVGEEMA